MSAATVVTVLGARPQFIKAAVVSPALRQVMREILVHTGQHYDPSLSDIFFTELTIPPPDYELGIGSGTHGFQTGAMLARLESILLAERPQVVLVYGDTNSTLAGALAAAKLGIPVAHVEAGLRAFNRQMPEEINRVLTDHLADALYCPTEEAVANLFREGLTAGVTLSGDVMDAAAWSVPPDPNVLSAWRLAAHTYYLATVHRAANTDDATVLEGVLGALAALPRTVVLPLHPRTEGRIRQFGLESTLKAPIRVIPPQGYRAMLTLERYARAVITDSGGVQREAALFGVPTYVLRDETEWQELVASGRVVLVGTQPAQIVEAVTHDTARGAPRPPTTDPVSTIVADLKARYGGAQ